MYDGNQNALELRMKLNALGKVKDKRANKKNTAR
jgi:hypothetical protein